MNTRRIILIIFATCATAHAMQFKFVPNDGGTPVMIDRKTAVAMSPVFKNLIEDLPAENEEEVVEIPTPFATNTLRPLVAAMQGAYKRKDPEKAYEAVVKADCVTRNKIMALNNNPAAALDRLRAGALHLLQAVSFFNVNKLVLDTCARHVAKRVQFVHDCRRSELKPAVTCHKQYDDGNQKWWLAVMKICTPRAQRHTLKWLYLLDPKAKLKPDYCSGNSGTSLSLPIASVCVDQADWEALLRCSAAKIARYKRGLPVHTEPPTDNMRYPSQQINHTIDNGIITSLAGFQAIERVPRDLDGLIIKENYLYEIPTDAFSKCTMLRLLDLSGNRLTSACTQEILKVKTLTTLKLRDNAIDALPPDLFNRLPVLAELDVTGNRLTSMPVSLAKASQLWALCCSKNYLPTNHRDEPAIAAWDRERPCCAPKWCLAYGPQNSLPYTR